MELLRPHTLSTAGPSSLAPLLPAIRTTISFSKARRSAPHHFPRLSATAALSSPAHSFFSPPSESSLAMTNRWMVIMEKPRVAGSSKSEIIDYYVETEKEAQMCIYDASCESNFGFCCDIDEESSRQLTRIPGVLSVRPDSSLENGKKDYSRLSLLLADQSKSDSSAPKFYPMEKDHKYWLVRLEKPGVETVTKAQMVDYYAQILTKVLRNEKDAQVSIYHISWEKDYGFCCHIDEECAQDLSNVPGVLSVSADLNFGSQIKDYKGNDPLLKSSNSSEANQMNVKTKRLFVTGLSFYTSEKTLRAAFEGFGELVEVKVIMDKISKRSKGYAFLEYTTEEAAGAALKEMNGKIINGWMIVVDVARTNASRSPRGRPRDQTRQLP
ncbi:Glycine-rich RNA-binding protein 4, mitochondrial [Apostasia shenzhenica]|uniref:Glycine-rich RNA-binding protein 4, mitochondrial n=1 Tax=Apostasia shenzhenica TaxID=1088818 RepID=A0A2I0BCX4_9ASPA|nr:Glycine-rich RNA-binding protein 4, mitochondrial [Apostasia shenzhenica]